ncbi:hypothetical protein BGZ61DRAFT_40211 [Ilyonectria robusta]|uniref:uncharacterized protein n=1 Tax=Ilyonectria robusta TaxID=1079257 RepID=UPI001E8CB6E3|nr:uncharacterized protein BGZ61DRAFT_40211 [Ilyonectria robusta]KAH8688213.1 hypothetical protein BGZ61DRAFT_40211 [Ilyonectria robusta]
MSAGNRILGVGVIGCGEVAQVIHIPTLGFLSDRFRVTYLCDVSDNALEHAKSKVVGGVAKTTRDPKELCASPDVDVVFVVNSTEYHADHAILALQSNKYVLLEKPAAFNVRDLQRIKAAEKSSQGKVMVGYMRRYAAAFQTAIKEIGGIDKILYARVRDIIGPNSAFVSQSGTFPKKFSDFQQEDSDDLKARNTESVGIGLTECGAETSEGNRIFWQFLGSLASHDLSAMREVLGMPEGVFGASVTMPFWNVLFKYPGFNVSYESGIDNVPRFDAHITVYGSEKTVRIQYDTPYVKGLPITVHVSENVDGVFKETTVRTTYEDAYTQEMRELYDLVTLNKPVKTTIEDSEDDFKIFNMIMKAL